MSKKEKVTETPEQEKKVVTRYDRRMQKRKEQEERLQREHKITLAISVRRLIRFMPRTAHIFLTLDWICRLICPSRCIPAP